MCRKDHDHWPIDLLDFRNFVVPFFSISDTLLQIEMELRKYQNPAIYEARFAEAGPQANGQEQL